jgi:hypothetical protein
VVLGLKPGEEDRFSWFEIDMLGQRHHYQEETQWNHTRSIIAALTGEKPANIMPLSFDKKEQVTTTQADIERIRGKYKKQ